MNLTRVNLVQKAIDAALENNWYKAVEFNKRIISQNPKDLEAYNRLGRAHLELGRTNVAKKIYKQVLDLDPYNQIALKNFKRISKITKISNNNNNHSQPINSQIFLSEPGKTKLVTLVKIAAPATLSVLSIGEKVELVYKKHGVTIMNQDKAYLGALPDDLAHRLLSLSSSGNRYEAYLKSVKTNSLQIIICEVYRSKRFVNQPSFLEAGSKTYYPPLRQEQSAITDEPLVYDENDTDETSDSKDESSERV